MFQKDIKNTKTTCGLLLQPRRRIMEVTKVYTEEWNWPEDEPEEGEATCVFAEKLHYRVHFNGYLVGG